MWPEPGASLPLGSTGGSGTPLVAHSDGDVWMGRRSSGDRGQDLVAVLGARYSDESAAREYLDQVAELSRPARPAGPSSTRQSCRLHLYGESRAPAPPPSPAGGLTAVLGRSATTEPGRSACQPAAIWPGAYGRGCPLCARSSRPAAVTKATIALARSSPRRLYSSDVSAAK